MRKSKILRLSSHSRFLEKLALNCLKVTKMESIIDHRKDYGVGALRGQRHIPTKKLTHVPNIETVQDKLCSNMEAFQDNLCFIFDLEESFINKAFHVIELGSFT